jgi:hypothetical protein
MSLSLINEIWKVLKPSIEVGDTSEAAETLVNYLVEEDYSPAEIKQIFRSDKDIKDAVSFYLEKPEDGLFFDHVEDPYEDEYYDDYDDDDPF